LEEVQQSWRATRKDPFEEAGTGVIRVQDYLAVLRTVVTARLQSESRGAPCTTPPLVW
jgi:hypothetical protein